MQFEAALGALPCRIGECLKQSAELRAAGNGARPGHLQGARAADGDFPRRHFCRLLRGALTATVLGAPWAVVPVLHGSSLAALNCRGSVGALAGAARQ